MKDFPVFTTENGVASLILSQIPYSATAYITIRSSQTPASLLAECVDLCTAAGAERIYASGDPCLRIYPEHTKILRMCCDTANLAQPECALFPVQEKTLEHWREIYNEKMADVPNSAYMSIAAAKERLQAGGMYFAHKAGTLLGIGLINDNKIEAIAATVTGAGKEIMRALASAIFSDSIHLDVAETNYRAMRLYHSLGFIPVSELSIWYQVK